MSDDQPRPARRWGTVEEVSGQPHPLARLRTLRPGDVLTEGDITQIFKLLAVHDVQAIAALTESIPPDTSQFLTLWLFLELRASNPKVEARVRMIAERVQRDERTIYRWLKHAKEKYGDNPWCH